MSRILYFDCAYGISGDMTLGALLDLGMSLQTLKTELEKVPFGGYTLGSTQVLRHGVPATKAEVVLKESHPDNQTERNIVDIQNLIQKSTLAEGIKQKSLAMFEVLANAQAEAHGILFNEVHFHEKGAVDSLVDVIGAAVCLSNFNVEKVAASPLRDGSGFIQCRCGKLPVPVPATRIITERFSIPTKALPVQSELVTPTGAAIAAVMVSEFCESFPKGSSLIKTGAGAGEYEYGEGGYLKCHLLE